MKERPTRQQLRFNMRRMANENRDIADEMSAMFDGCDDPLHPFMPVGKDQVFRDWLDFVEKVARPVVECEDEDGSEMQAAMALYRKASPYFICTALVMAANRIVEHEGREGTP